jgi:hypothetical protein
MQMSKNVEDAEKLADKYFAFLLTDYGFAKVNGYYASYEYNFGSREANIEIHLQCDADGSSIPFVELRDHSQMSPMGVPDRYPLIGIEMKPAVKKIFANRNEREKINREKFPVLSDHLKEYVELGQADYDKYGRDEMEILIKGNAEIIKRHPEILRGDLSIFPKKKPKKGPVRTTISMRQPDGSMKVTEYIDGRKVNNGGFTRWLRSVFNAKKLPP